MGRLWDDFIFTILRQNAAWDDLWDDFTPLGRFHFPNPSIKQALGRFGAELDPGCIRWSRTALDDGGSLVPHAGLKQIQSEFQSDFKLKFSRFQSNSKRFKPKTSIVQSLDIRQRKSLSFSEFRKGWGPYVYTSSPNLPLSLPLNSLKMISCLRNPQIALSSSEPFRTQPHGTALNRTYPNHDFFTHGFRSQSELSVFM